MKIKNLNIRGIIWDVDGTLVDSNEAHARAWQEVFRSEGWPTDYQTIRSLIGTGGDKLMPVVTGVASTDPLGEKLSKLRGQVFRKKFLPRLKAFPGARELLCTLKSLGIRMAIATSATRKDLDAVLKQSGLDDLIEEPQMICTEDAKRSKPDPDIVLQAMASLKLPRHEMLLIGDTPYDLEAAQSAGIASLAFRCGGFWNANELNRAHWQLEGPQQFLQKLELRLLA